MLTSPSLNYFYNKLRMPTAITALTLTLSPFSLAELTQTTQLLTAAASETPPANQRLLWLRGEIARHDELYFKKNTPEISDAAYDALKRELVQLEQKPAPTSASIEATSRNTQEPVSPTGVHGFGDDRSGSFPTRTHGQRMLSLDKAYTESELRAFIARVEHKTGRTDLRWVVEPKFDGLAISVTYENGRLVRAVTRGDGNQGDDVTANACTIPALLNTLPHGAPDLVELRGEVFIDYPEFARLNAEREEAGEPPFATPRNLAAGTLKQHDPCEVAKRHLRIVFYGLGSWEGTTAAPDSQQALRSLIREWNLPYVESPAVAKTADEVWAAITQLGRHRTALGVPTDGTVVKVDDRAVQLELGASDEAPRWAIAYKYPPQQVATRLQKITLQVGRTGIITPVAELEPVVIGGTTISRASLYNADAIARRDLRLGDWVFVEKAGEIIPVVVGPDTSRRSAKVVPYPFPATCPECENKLVRHDGEATTWCVNKTCLGQRRKRIEHYASAEAAAIKGLGPNLITALVYGRKIITVADIYRLHREDIVITCGVSDLVAGQVMEQINESKKITLGRLMFGLSIPGVGKTAATEWAGRFTDLAQWSTALKEELSERNSMAAESVVVFFSRPENRNLVADLKKYGVNPLQNNGVSSNGAFAGKTLVLSGTLPTLTRAEATQRIVASGGRIASAVNTNTDWLVAGEGAGIKLTEARRLGIHILDETELLRRLAP